MAEYLRGVEDKIAAIKEADILIGIPSYNNARTIGHVVRAVRAGLAKYFPDQKAVLVNSDGGSTDGTRDVVLNTESDNLQSIFTYHRVGPVYSIAIPYHGIPGKGSAFRTIFAIADKLNVKACAVVDSDLRSITPEWIELLIKPVLQGDFDYVTPLYHRHKYDGTITNSIIYTMTRALYGKRVRQPIGGDFGFSGELARFYLAKDVWETDVARFGIDIWMTTTAIANNFRVCQSYLGAKIHDAKDPGADLSAMLYQVVSATFDLMETYSGVWSKINSSEPVTTFGFQYAVGLEPVVVNIGRMLEKFRLGVRDLLEIWQGFLPSSVMLFLAETQNQPDDKFNFPDEIWVETIYSFALAYHNKVISREHLLKSLTPLYIGRTASFVIERLCNIFETKKSLLVDNWQEKGGKHG